MKLLPKCGSSINPLNPSGLTNCQSGHRCKRAKGGRRKKDTENSTLGRSILVSLFSPLIPQCFQLRQPSWDPGTGTPAWQPLHPPTRSPTSCSSFSLWATLSSLSGAVSSSWSLTPPTHTQLQALKLHPSLRGRAGREGRERAQHLLNQHTHMCAQDECSAFFPSIFLSFCHKQYLYFLEPDTQSC